MKESLRERLVAVASIVGYPMFYVACLLVFAALTFPLDKVRDRLVASFNESQRAANSTRELAIADLSSSWITGVKLTGVRLMDRDQAVDRTKPGGETAGDLKVDSLVVRVSMLPLLVGSHNVSFDAEAFGGKVSGTWSDTSKERSLDLTLEALDLSQVGPVTQLLEAPVEGSLGGSVKLTLPEGHFTKANGSIAIEASNVAVGDGKAKVMGKLAIPRLNVGTFTVNADVKDGTVKLTKLGGTGKDVDFLADGRIPLREQVMDSQVDVNLRFRISDTYRAKSDATKALFGTPDSNIPGLMDMEPRMKQSKRADGFYAWHARGPLGKLDFSPGGTGGPMGGPGGANSGPGAGPATSTGPSGRAKIGP